MPFSRTSDLVTAQTVFISESVYIRNLLRMIAISYYVRDRQGLQRGQEQPLLLAFVIGTAGSDR